MYFPFVTLIFAWARKSLLRSFHIVNGERHDLSLIFPSLRLLRLLRGKRWPRIFSCYFVSSGVMTLNVFSIRYIRYADFCMDQEKPVTFVSYCK